MCCDGYTEFCCTLNGVNGCPSGTVPGGWWKVDGSSFCGGRARYYIDCHRSCGSCGCGSGGICSGACSSTSCGCAQGSCANRKSGCTQFRYGNCNNQRACIGPILCRVVSCTEPWKMDATCSSTAVRTDNNTRWHNRSCAQQSRITPVVGNWDTSATQGIGFYNNRNGVWTARQTASEGGNALSFQFGKSVGDIPVVGDWDGDGRDGIGVYRPATGLWYLRNTASSGSATIVFEFGGEPGDIPVVGDWNGDGRDGIGLYRPSVGTWYLRETASAGSSNRIVAYGPKWVIG